MENGKVNIYLMRHGETILNKAGRTQGWCDGVLTDEGVEVAINTGLGLSNIEFKNFYASDLGRAINTAKIVIKENEFADDKSLIEVRGLREVYFGKYEGEKEGVLYHDMLDYFKVESFAQLTKEPDFQKKFCDTCALLDETNKAESYETALKRAMDSLTEIAEANAKNNGGNILVVAHGGIIRLIIDYLDKNINVRNLVNSSISMVTYENGKFSVESFNDTSYSDTGKMLRSL